MDQPKSTKRMLAVRVAPAGYEAIERLAEEADVPVSAMVRRLLAYAVTTMPKHWVPTRPTKEQAK